MKLPLSATSGSCPLLVAMTTGDWLARALSTASANWVRSSVKRSGAGVAGGTAPCAMGVGPIYDGIGAQHTGRAGTDPGGCCPVVLQTAAASTGCAESHGNAAIILLTMEVRHARRARS